MRELVMSVLNISGQAAIIFAALLVVRGSFALGRVPKKYACGLWAILFIRLLLPIQLGAYLLTCLYWFHPLVWAGFILMSRDMEMSCDEAVLRRMGGDCRGEYADSLLQLTSGRHYPAAAPLAFGEGDTRGRIKHIMRYRKAAAAVAVAAVALTGILAAVLLASPREGAAGNGRQEFSFQVAYRDVVPCPLPVMTGDTSLGADGAILDYADEDKVIFHGNFGLYIYSVSAGETVGAVDLRALGCGDAQGDNTCQVLVNRDGSRVYFYPLGGISEAVGLDQGEQGHVIYSYVYDAQNGRLRIVSWNLGQSGDSWEEIGFSRLTGEELAESRAVPVAEVEQNVWEQGFCSYLGLVFEKGGEQVFGYLKSASETLEDLVYVQRPVYGEDLTEVQRPEDEKKPGAESGRADWREAVRLFGTDGQGISAVSYDRRETTPRITIDGATYDLCKAMTQCRFEDGTVEYPSGNTSVSAIAGLQCVDGLWIVKGYINPSRGTYSFYDPAAGEWVGHIVATCLTWNSRNEKRALWEGNRESRLSTVIYALNNKVYSLQDGLLLCLPQEQAKGGEVGLPQEEIYGLRRDGDEITVEIRSTQTEEKRTVQFHYERYELGRGAVKLE